MAQDVGQTLNSLSNPEDNPLVQTENAAILGFHADLETLGHETDTANTIHGLTNLGETTGLGQVGGDNLITDTAKAPGDIIDGTNPVTEVSGLVTDWK